jgi:adenylate kinase family enzyme
MSTQPQATDSPLRVFYSYAREDEEYLRNLEKHLKSLEKTRVIEPWFDQQLSPGADWSREINARLQSADLILLLISPDFMASDYIYQKELQIAVRRHELGEVRVVPIILRPVDWKAGPFADIQALPPKGLPVTVYKNTDEAFTEIARGIRHICQDIIAARANIHRNVEVRSPNFTKCSLAQVFVKSGFPQVTFVEPEDFTLLKLALQQPGRGVIIEGPSGVGKTTSIVKIVDDLIKDGSYTNLSIKHMLSARNPEHREQLRTIRDWHQETVIIDDFHILDSETRHAMVNYLKELADTTSTTRKLAIIGIPRTGQALVDMSFDLATRIDVFTFGKASDEAILQMIEKGENALNAKFDRKAEIVLTANGSLNLAQFLCFNVCAGANVIETQEQTQFIQCDIDAAKKSMTVDLGRKFEQTIRQFLALGGPRDLTSLRLLEELILRPEGSLPLLQLKYTNPQLEQGIERFITEKWMENLYKAYPEAENHLSFDQGRQILTVDDPQLDFYLKQVHLANLAREVGKFPLLTRRKIFISYSHRDRKWLDRLLMHLMPIEREGGLDLWDDTKLLAGQNWKEAIRDALETAKVIVLLVSANFLASDFIAEGELPALLSRTNASGIAVIPVILSPCAFHYTNLSMFQAINSPEHTLTSMSLIEQDKTFARVAQVILEQLREA